MRSVSPEEQRGILKITVKEYYQEQSSIIETDLGKRGSK